MLGLDVLETKKAPTPTSTRISSQIRVSRVSSTPSNHGQRSVPNVVPLGGTPPRTPVTNVSSKSPQQRDNHIDDDSNEDEMVEVTPDLSMFGGNHFLSDMMQMQNGGHSAGHSEDESAGGSPMSGAPPFDGATQPCATVGAGQFPCTCSVHID